MGEPTSQCNPERHLILVYAVFYKYTYMLEVLTKKICISISSWKSGLGDNRGLPFLQGSNNLELDNMKAKKTQQVGAETSKG